MSTVTLQTTPSARYTDSNYPIELGDVLAIGGQYGVALEDAPNGEEFAYSTKGTWPTKVPDGTIAGTYLRVDPDSQALVVGGQAIRRPLPLEQGSGENGIGRAMTDRDAAGRAQVLLLDSIGVLDLSGAVALSQSNDDPQNGIDTSIIVMSIDDPGVPIVVTVTPDEGNPIVSTPLAYDAVRDTVVDGFADAFPIGGDDLLTGLVFNGEEFDQLRRRPVTITVTDEQGNDLVPDFVTIEVVNAGEWPNPRWPTVGQIHVNKDDTPHRRFVNDSEVRDMPDWHQLGNPIDHLPDLGVDDTLADVIDAYNLLLLSLVGSGNMRDVS